MIGRTLRLRIVVCGEESLVTMSPSVSLRCKSFSFFVIFLVGLTWIILFISVFSDT